MKKQWIVLAILIAAYTFYFSWLTISRHDNGYSGRYDLGHMEQTVWNTSNGHIFEMTNPDTSKISSRLAFHADFLLVLIAPIYKLFPRTETLLIIQAFVVALGSVAVYLIGRYIFVGDDFYIVPKADRHRSLSLQSILPLLFAVLYLLSPIIQRANIFDFHSEVLAVTFLLFTFYFLLIGRARFFILFFILSFISKETVSLNLVMICLWGMVKNKNRRLCFALAIFSLLYFSAMMRFIIPASNETLERHFALRHFTEGNESFGEVILGYLKNPLGVVITLIGSDARAYYAKIFSFGGLIQFLSPFALLFSLPTIFINVLVRDPQFRALDYQYAATILPGVMISLVYGTRQIFKTFYVIPAQAGIQNSSYEDEKPQKILDSRFRGNDNNVFVPSPKAPRKSNITSFIYFFSLLLTFYSLLLNLREYSPVPALGKSPLNYAKTSLTAQKVREWAAKIPSDKSVSVTNNAGAHFAKRQNLYVFPDKIGDADYVVVAVKSWQEPVTDAERDRIIERLKKDRRYRIADESEGVWVFEKIDEL